MTPRSRRFGVALLVLALLATGCKSKADRASENLSKAADNFEIPRRFVAINGITDTEIMRIEGYCSKGNDDDSSAFVTVTCKTGPGAYVKEFVGRSDNVVWTIVQLDPAEVSDTHARVIFRPGTAIPNVDLG